MFRVPGARTLLTVLCLLPLAGCLGDGGPPHADPDRSAGPDVSPVPSSFDLEACLVHEGRFVVPAAMVADDVPEGFEAVSPDGMGQTAWLGMLGFSCTSFLIDGVAQSGPYVELRTFVIVEPPEALRGDGVDEYHVQFVNYVGSVDAVPMYEAWGHWAWEADVRFTESSTGPLSVGMVGADDGAEPWELHTLVDPASRSCDQTLRVGVFGWFQDVLVGRVDLTLEGACRATGPAKGLLPEALDGAPDDALLLSLVNGFLTGSGAQYRGDGLALTQRFVPLSP